MITTTSLSTTSITKIEEQENIFIKYYVIIIILIIAFMIIFIVNIPNLCKCIDYINIKISNICIYIGNRRNNYIQEHINDEEIEENIMEEKKISVLKEITIDKLDENNETCIFKNVQFCCM